MTWNRATFALDSLAGTFDGWTTGETWNGWATPVFELPVALRIADAYRNQPDGFGPHVATFDEAADGFHVEEDGNDPSFFGSDIITADGHDVRVYFLGTAYWTWEEERD